MTAEDLSWMRPHLPTQMPKTTPVSDALRERLRLAEAALETAIKLWARETTGLGGKLDRYACLKEFKEQAEAYRKARDDK